MGANILIVEDDSYLVQAYRAKLTAAGFTLQVVSDGKEALEALKTFVPDLIILDLVMPKMDGYSFLAEMKKMTQWKGPVVIVTSLETEDDIVKAKKAGATDFIIKSDISIDDLVLRIKTALSNRRASNH